MQPPVQSCLPSLEDLACGNTTGLRPQAVTKAQLDIARPLQQVKAYPITECITQWLSSICPGLHMPSEIACRGEVGQVSGI